MLGMGRQRWRELCAQPAETQQSLTLQAVQSEEPLDTPRGRAVHSNLDNTPGENSHDGEPIMMSGLNEPGRGCVTRIILYTAEVSSLILFSSNERELQVYIFIYIHIYCNYMYIFGDEHGVRWQWFGLEGKFTPKTQ